MPTTYDTVEEVIYRYYIEAWRQIKQAGLDRYAGQRIRGVEITPQHLLSGYHSKGLAGLRQLLESGAVGLFFSTQGNDFLAGSSSSTELVSQLTRSRRRSFERDLFELFTGGGINTPDSTPPLIPGKSEDRLGANVFGLLEILLGAALGGGTRTRTATSESARSIEARDRWNLSQSQQQALLAQQLQQGNKNL